MTSATELGISEQEYQDATNLEKIYNIIKQYRVVCSKCRNSPTHIDCSKSQFLCQAHAVGRSSVCKKINEERFTSFEIQKLISQYTDNTSANSFSGNRSRSDHLRKSRSRHHTKPSRRRHRAPSSSDENQDSFNFEHENSLPKSDHSRYREKSPDDFKFVSAFQNDGSLSPPATFSSNSAYPPGMAGILMQKNQLKQNYQPNSSYNEMHSSHNLFSPDAFDGTFQSKRDAYSAELQNFNQTADNQLNNLQNFSGYYQVPPNVMNFPQSSQNALSMRLPHNQLMQNQQIPNQQIPNQQILNQQIPNQQIPNQQILNQQIPNQQIMNQQIPNQQIPNQQIPNQQPLNQQIPNQQPQIPQTYATQMQNTPLQNPQMHNAQFPNEALQWSYRANNFNSYPFSYSYQSMAPSVSKYNKNDFSGFQSLYSSVGNSNAFPMQPKFPSYAGHQNVQTYEPSVPNYCCSVTNPFAKPLNCDSNSCTQSSKTNSTQLTTNHFIDSNARLQNSSFLSNFSQPQNYSFQPTQAINSQSINPLLLQSTQSLSQQNFESPTLQHKYHSPYQSTPWTNSPVSYQDENRFRSTFNDKIPYLAATVQKDWWD